MGADEEDMIHNELSRFIIGARRMNRIIDLPTPIIPSGGGDARVLCQYQMR